MFLGVAGLSGGYVCFNIGVYSYIADISQVQRRTSRMSLLNGMFSLGFVVGIQLGSAIVQYWTVFLLSSLFGSLGLLYTVFILREARELDNVKPVAVFECSHIRESFTTVLGNNESRRRSLVLVLLCSFLALMLCLNTGDFDYLMTRLKFGWTASEWGLYLTVQRVTRLISLLAILPVLSILLGLSDNTIIMAGLAVTSISYSMLSLTSQAWMVYTSALLQMNSITSVAIRSKLSKLVRSDEVGKMFAVVGVGQSAVSLLSQSVFGAVYRLTLSSLPSAYLLIVVTALATSLIALIAVLLLVRPRDQHLEENID